MIVKDIVVKWIKDNGYDGLASEDCGCSIDTLPACDGYAGDFVHCKPAIRFECSKCNDRGGCEYRVIYDVTECFIAAESEVQSERTKNSNQR